MRSKDNEERLERLKNIVLSMPEKPGSYQYYDAEGTIIYVGKAKNLKRRVSSYFHKEVDRFKTKVLVSKICDITYTVVNTEEDALLLENALIKKYNPRYNVLLKDGKTYPSICITNEPFPRIFKTRTINKRYGQFFGPYSHLGSMYTILELIKKLYRPRTCRLALTDENVREGRFKPCLEYHIKNCGAPCAALQSREEYLENIALAREILKGNTRSLSDFLYNKMMKAAEELRFEEAEELKRQYLLTEQFCAKSEVVSHTVTNVDVFSIDDDDSKSNAFINYMHVTNGTINQSFTYEYKRKLEETDHDLLLQAITEIRERFKSTAKETIVPFEIDWKLEGTTFFVPQRGDKYHLLELSQMNCRQYRFDRLKQADKLNPEQKYTRLMKELQEKLQLEKLPYIIELFDNSNISGTDAVAGCVVYKGMKPSKKDYRKYNIKTVTGPDDYASMREVVGRRYRVFSNRPEALYTALGVTPDSLPDNDRDTDRGIPDLIITDGGIGQMSIVREMVEDVLGLHIPIAGLAKNDKHRTNELLFGLPPRTIQLKPESELFRLLTQMQDEVHRYAISFHRDKRSKHALHSELADIKGIGPKAVENLIKTFKSVKRVREAAMDSARNSEIAVLIGPAKTQLLVDYFTTKSVKENDENGL
ncbi:MAG: excinuclease ABC subunit UvrC [Prevotellaceae bacterium]|nr:excinuclease ABC subunit UvrC [Prevotellaceae bacterium]